MRFPWWFLLGALLALGSAWYYALERPESPSYSAMTPPIQVGRTRPYQARSMDASSWTTAQRRRAVIAGPFTWGHKGSTNGSLEKFFMTGICVCPFKGKVCNIHTYDGGGADASDSWDIWDGGTLDPAVNYNDAGGVNDPILDGGAPTEVFYDGNDLFGQLVTILEGGGVDPNWFNSLSDEADAGYAGPILTGFVEGGDFVDGNGPNFCP